MENEFLTSISILYAMDQEIGTMDSNAVACKTRSFIMTEADVFEIIKRYAEFPYGQICKHSLGLTLLSMMEERGVEPNKPLIEAVVNADDCKTLELLKGY